MAGIHLVNGLGAVTEPLDDARASAIGDAARHHSTFYLAAHGAEAAVARLFAATRAFFALPLDERRRVAASGAQESGYHGGDRATQVFVVNRAPAHLRPVFGDDRWPAHPASLAQAAHDYLDAMYPLAMRVLGAAARDLDLPADYFEPMFGDGAIQNLQLRFYDAAPPTRPVPLDAHTDPPPITFIAQDDVGGLESYINREWVPVTPIADTLVCQFGALMGRWTDDLYPASVHRVKSRDSASRFSLVYNLLPRPDALVEPVPTRRVARGPTNTAPLTVETFLRTRLREAVSYSATPTDAPAVSADVAARADALPREMIERCREAVHRTSRGAWSLTQTTRVGTGVRVEMAAGAQKVSVDVTRADAERPCYRSIGRLAFSYRGQIRDAAVFQALDRVLSGLAAVLAGVI